MEVGLISRGLTMQSREPGWKQIQILPFLQTRLPNDRRNVGLATPSSILTVISVFGISCGGADAETGTGGVETEVMVSVVTDGGTAVVDVLGEEIVVKVTGLLVVGAEVVTTGLLVDGTGADTGLIVEGT